MEQGYHVIALTLDLIPLLLREFRGEKRGEIRKGTGACLDQKVAAAQASS